MTEIDGLIRLQAILCTIAFLISQSRLSSAYNYISVAATSAIKQGLHIPAETVTPSDKIQISMQILTTLVSIDLYVSTVLGLPSLIKFDIAGITLKTARESGSFGQVKSQGYFETQNVRHSLQAVSSDFSRKYCQIVSMAASVTCDLSALSTGSSQGRAAMIEVDAALLRSAERDLTIWTRGIGIALPPSVPDSDDVPVRASVTKHELELSIYWAQLLLYLPFLRYLRPLADGQSIPGSLSRPALTCLKVAVNTIVCCENLLFTLSYSEAYRHFMHSSNWTCIYTIFLAVVALIFLISIHEGTSKPSEAWRKAETGIKILAALRCHSGGASRCLAIIQELVRQLNYTVDFDIEQIERTTPKVCQRWADRDGHATATDAFFGRVPEGASSSFIESRDVQMSSVNQHFGPGLAEAGMMSSADAMLATAQHIHTTNDRVVNGSIE